MSKAAINQTAKGKRFEQEVCAVFRSHDLTAIRTPRSGATDFQKGDVVITPGFDDSVRYVAECKRRAKLPAIFNELGEHDFLIVRADRGESHVVMTLDKLAELLQ